MKKIKNVLLAVMMLGVFVGCKKDEPAVIETKPIGKVVLEFENTYQDVALQLNSDYTTPPPMEQKIVLSRFSYIISDVSLVNEAGDEVKYYHTNPDKGAFLVEQKEGKTTKKIELSDIPVGKYTKVKFRLGISNEAWKLGESKQSAFWKAASDAQMAWDWAKGYKHTSFEGTWGTNESGAVNPFKVHFTSNPAEGVDNSLVLTLNLPTALVLAENGTMNIRFDVNSSVVFGGKNKLEITSENAVIEDAKNDIFVKVKENLSFNLFKAASVY